MVGDDDEDGAVVLDNLRNLSGDRIVPTAAGPVLVTDVSDNEHPYRPDGDLIGLALRLGQAMQNGGTHVVDVCIGPSILVSIDQSPAFAAAMAGIGGRVSVEGVSITLRGLGDVEIDLIEAATPEDAAVLAAGASADLCLHERRLVGLIDGSKARSFVPIVDEVLAARSDGEPDR
jgi:hypothetical protein